MAAYTSAATGNWSAAGTWTVAPPAGGPGAGDTVTIAAGHTVTVDSAAGASANGQVTIGTSPAATAAGSASASPQLVISNTATLTIGAGNLLRVRGDANYAGGLTLGAGATLEIDGSQNAGQAYRLCQCQVGGAGTAAGTILTANGTSGSHAVIRSNASGTNGYLDAIGNRGCYNLNYTDLSALGSATVPSVLCAANNSANVFTVIRTNCTFSNCGVLKDTQIPAGNGSVWRLEDTKFSGSLDTTHGPWYPATAAALTSGSRTCLRNSFDTAPYLSPVDTFDVEGNVFVSGYQLVAGTPATQKTNFVVGKSLSGQNAPDYAVKGSTQGNYWFVYPSGGVGSADDTNPHFFSAAQSSGTQTFDGEIFEYGGNNGTGDSILLGSPAAVTTFEAIRCIKLPNIAGASSGTLLSALGNTNARVVVEHCTMHGGGGTDSSGARIGETQASFAGEVTSFRGNLYWDSTARGYALTDISATPTQDAVTAANCDYNVKYNAATSPSSGAGAVLVGGTGTAVNGYYGLSVSGATAPGAHDSTANPSFVDSTRCLRTWFRSPTGANQATTGTDAGDNSAAITYLQNNPSQAASLIAWVRAGFVPTNAALANFGGAGVAFPGDTATVDAAGNALNGTAGAMAYAASGGAARFRRVPLTGGMRDLAGLGQQ